MSAVELRYHAQALRLLGVEPRVSTRAVRALDRCEAACGVRLPAAVREFYSLDGLPARLYREDWCAGPVRLGTFLAGVRHAVAVPPGRRPRHPGTRQPYPHPAARFYQDGGDSVRVLLDGTDDPPTDSGGPYPFTGFDAPEGSYLSFSRYVRLATWSARTDRTFVAYVGLDSPPGGKALAGPPHLDFLLERYEEWDRAVDPDWSPPAHHFGFFGPAGRVHLRTAGDPAAAVVPACWWLHADTEEGLFDLYAELWPCHGYPVKAEAPEWDPHGRLQRRFRRRFPAHPETTSKPRKRGGR